MRLHAGPNVAMAARRGRLQFKPLDQSQDQGVLVSLGDLERDEDQPGSEFSVHSINPAVDHLTGGVLASRLWTHHAADHRMMLVELVGRSLATNAARDRR